MNLVRWNYLVCNIVRNLRWLRLRYDCFIRNKCMKGDLVKDFKDDIEVILFYKIVEKYVVSGFR